MRLPLCQNCPKYCHNGPMRKAVFKVCSTRCDIAPRRGFCVLSHSTHLYEPPSTDPPSKATRRGKEWFHAAARLAPASGLVREIQLRRPSPAGAVCKQRRGQSDGHQVRSPGLDQGIDVVDHPARPQHAATRQSCDSRSDRSAEPA